MCNKRHNAILISYYENHSFTEIGLKFGISRQAAEQTVRKSGVVKRGKQSRIRPYKRTPLTTRQKFWAQVDSSESSGSCWPWIGNSFHPFGYGLFSTGRLMKVKRGLSHQVAFLFSWGKWAKLGVLHRCGNAVCCNPAHLYEGTQKENARDRDGHLALVNKSIGVLVAQSRERKGKLLLSAEKARQIRQMLNMGNVRQKDIARQFSIPRQLVSRIKTGRSYAWV